MFGDKLKSLISKKSEEKGKENKKIENLVFFIVVLIITIVVINIIWNGNKQTDKQENVISSKKLATITESDAKKSDEEETYALQSELENILSQIQGVGQVKVFINCSESSQVVAMYNENTRTSNTEENDTSGGTRKIEEINSQKDIIYEEDNSGVKRPITQKVIEPKLEGAIITAKGANNPEIKANIIQAVEAATGLASHKIQVFEMN